MTDKTNIRALITATRARLSPAEIATARQAIRAAVRSYCTQLELPPGSRIAAYQPLRTEPGSTELLEQLTDAGYEVIVPVTQADRDLDWIRWSSAIQAGGIQAGGKSDLLGLDAIGNTALVLVPAFAVDRCGHRLGRGGGSYDRALGRVASNTPVAALIYDNELLEKVPVDRWDKPVSAAVSPSGWIHLTPRATGNRA